MTEEVIDFPNRSAVDREAADWLIRLDRDRPPSDEERAALRDWLARSAVHRDALRELAELWGKMNMLTELAVPLGELPDQTRHMRFGRSRLPLAAASVVLVLIVSAVFFGRAWWAADTLEATNGLYTTAVGKQKQTVLVDDSVIHMNTDSELRVTYTKQNRDIHLLRGEAHFTVTDNAALPFRVFAGNGKIEAIGTSFAVRLMNDGVDVAVTDGRVALAAIGQAEQGRVIQVDQPRNNAGVIARFDAVEELATITAGERALIAKPEGVVDVASVEVDTTKDINAINRRLSWREGVLTFTGEPLEEVVAEISRYTTLSIRIDDPAVRTVPVGGRFPIGETDAMLRVLETNFGLRVSRLGPNRVLLTVADE